MLIQRPPQLSLPRQREPRAAAAGALGAHGRGHVGRQARFRFAGLLSLGLHAVLLAGLVLWFRHAPTSGDAPQTSGAVELVMVEQQGAGVPTTPPEPAPAVAAPAPPQPELPAPPPPAPPPPPEVATADEALPLPPIPPPVAPPSTAPMVPNPPSPPPVQPAREALRINLGGTDSDSNAIVLPGPHVIPAGVDTRFHNRQPAYPLEAVRRAEQGAVILLIHVSQQGLSTGVDIAESSGFILLDRAARDAVLGWHFVPAVQDGQPIPFDMRLRVLFNLD